MTILHPSKAKKRTEEEIMSKWKYLDPPLVSICCITYNHKPYIRDAIEGFLMQETDFPFEIIIHDDASTDGNQGIIQEYVHEYPGIVKPVFQAKNQYSHKKAISPSFVWPLARGEYIALCEGDDYWITPFKLKIQIEKMKKINCSISFHKSIMISSDKLIKSTVVPSKISSKRVFSPEDSFYGFSSRSPTSSIVFRRNVLKWLYHSCHVISKCMIEDVFVRILGSLEGGTLFINKTMSVYRKAVPGSWSNMAKNTKNFNAITVNLLEAYSMLADFLPPKFAHCVDIKKSMCCYSASLEFIKLNRFFLFRCYIRKSWQIRKMLSLKQSFLYMISHEKSGLFFPLIRCLYIHVLARRGRSSSAASSHDGRSGKRKRVNMPRR